jgi:hypothetical protein
MSIPKTSSPATPHSYLAKKPLTPKASHPAESTSKPLPIMDVNNAHRQLNPSYLFGVITVPLSDVGIEKNGADYRLFQNKEGDYQVRQRLSNGDSNTCTFNQTTGQYMGNVGDNAHNRRTGDTAGTVACGTILDALKIPYKYNTPN